MMSFKFDSEPLNWVILVALLAVLVTQVWLIVRNESLSGQRKAIRLTLNGLLWLVLLGYVLQPSWSVTARTTHALLAGADVPGAYQRQLSDSLNLKEVVNARTFNGDRFDSVTLVGQEFPPELLSHLSRQAVRWIPYYAPDQVQAIRWKGVVQKGEMQWVTGKIQSSKKQAIKLMYGGRTLDSLNLPVGLAEFTLKFPAFVLGRTETELVLNQTTLDTVRFFARPMKPLTYQFILGTPDFESKTLADWLGKNGNSVQVTATLSKDISNKLTINRATGKPDVIITDPSNAGNAVVKRAVADGKAVLFINLTNPEADCRVINQALGSRWQVRKVSNEPLIPVGTGLFSLPYALTIKPAQTAIPGYPMAVQQSIGKIGISLLNETFPLKLSGDSLAYDRVWNAVLAQLHPSSSNVTELEAPIFAGFRETIHLNNLPKKPSMVRIGSDTLPLTYSPINELSAEGKTLIHQAGWLPIQDSVMTYAEATQFSGIADSRLVRTYALAHEADQTSRQTASRMAEVTVPDWLWLVFFLVCMTALWVEPKLG